MNQHNRSTEKVKSDDRHMREAMAAEMISRDSGFVIEEEKNRCGTLDYLFIALVLWLIAICFMAGNLYFERAEKHVEGIEMEKVK